jgi:hypothetical protein
MTDNSWARLATPRPTTSIYVGLHGIPDIDCAFVRPFVGVRAGHRRAHNRTVDAEKYLD